MAAKRTRIKKRIEKIQNIEESFQEEMESVKDSSLFETKPVNPLDLVPTGSTTLNLECSGKKEGAFLLGKMVNLIGDSSAGKTLFGFTVFAECSLLKRFDDYRFIYDDVEAANEFDIGYLFGKNVNSRIEAPITKRGKTEVHASKTIEDLNDNVANALDDGRPFIYILDSFDSLTSEAAINLDKENRKNREKGNQTSGSYGDGKAKIFSDFCKNRIQDLSERKSVLIVISQTRANLGFGAQFTPKIRSGGNALKFYSFHEIWLACEKKEKKKKRTIVTNVRAKITKNKVNGRHGEASFPIMFDYGVDNIASCIKFLHEDGDWTKSGASLNTQGFIPKKISSAKTESHRSTKEVIQYIEDHGMEDQLFALCQEAYDNVINALKSNRKRKY